MKLIKDMIVDAISAASDNAHDMGFEDCDTYAVGMIATEIIIGDPDELIDCPYLDSALFDAGLALEEDRLTRAEWRPHLFSGVREFMTTEGSAE